MVEEFSLKTIHIVILILWLVILSIEDIKHKKVSYLTIVFGGLLLFIFSIVLGELTITNRIGGISFGLIIMLISYVTRGQIGMGDGLIIAVIGLSFGLFMNLTLLTYGLFLSSITSILLLSFKKANKKSTIPFIPFILIACLGVIVL